MLPTPKPPMRVYLDQNPYDYLLDAGVSPETLSNAMKDNGYELIVSGDNLQEWASCWRNGDSKKEERGRHLVQFMLAIQPRRVLTSPEQLMIREVRNLFGSDLAGPFLPPEDLPRAEALFRRFAEGAPTESDLRQMRAHWNVKIQAGERAKEQAERWKGKADTSLTLNTFIGRYPEQWRATVHLYVQLSIGVEPTGKQMKYVLRHLNKCPALRAGALADFYTNWRIASGKVMQHDRWDDLRHCRNSGYANVFVTRDKALKTAFELIKPGPRIMTVAEFAEMLSIPYKGP